MVKENGSFPSERGGFVRDIDVFYSPKQHKDSRSLFSNVHSERMMGSGPKLE